MPAFGMRTSCIGAGVVATLLMLNACRTAAPAIRFAPPGTDAVHLRSDFPLSDSERLLLTPQNLKALTQAEVDQIYMRLSAGPMPDGPFRGDLFFPRDRDSHARIIDRADPAPKLPEHIAALRLEHFGRLLWKGKVFFRKEGILRNRIEDVSLLKLIVDDPATIPKLTFDGDTTWLLFPAKVSCAASRFDWRHPSITIDYAKGPTIEGYRHIPDDLAGEQALNILDEVRVIRPGFYLGRAYFGKRFGLNFTLIDPAVADGGAALTPDIQKDCQ